MKQNKPTNIKGEEMKSQKTDKSWIYKKLLADFQAIDAVSVSKEIQSGEPCISGTRMTIESLSRYIEEEFISQTLKRVEGIVEGMKKDAKQIRDMYFPYVKGEFNSTEEWGRIVESKIYYNQALSDLLKTLKEI